MRSKLLVTLALLLCVSIEVKAQDFMIKSFNENLTDLSAAMSGLKDRNKNDAALIRFAVRDDKFEIEPNLGAIKTERATGEIRVFVPEDTKRITIRHPMLGVLRDYNIPIPIKAKTTYDAEIVITNSDYMLAVFGGANVTNQPIKEPEIEELPIVEQPIEEPKEEPVVVQPQTKPEEAMVIKKKDPKAPLDLHFYAGRGFNAISVMGPSVNIGVRYKIYAVEAGFALGLDKAEDINFTLRDYLSESYDYSCSKVWVRLGANFDFDLFRITPQAGMTFNMISGKAPDGVKNTTDYFEASNPMAIFIALRFSYKVAENLSVHLTPQYDFAIGGDQVFDVIKQADNKIKGWGEGFGVNAGLIYEF